MANVRNNLLYRLRKKGVRVQTRERTIYFAYDGEPLKIIQVKRLSTIRNIKKVYDEKNKRFDGNCNLHSRFK